MIIRLFLISIAINIFCFLTLQCSAVFAENQDTISNTPIIITPPLNDTLSVGETTVLPRRYLLQSPVLQLDDLLRQFSGFTTFRRTSSRTANPTIQGASLRGTAPTATSRTSVLLNNIPLNDPFGGWVQWNRLPLEFADSVRIDRGAAGISAYSMLDGVIRIESGPRRDKPSSISLYGGSRGSARITSRISKTLSDRTLLELSGDLTRSDGQYVIRASDRGEIDTRAGYQSIVSSAQSLTALDSKKELSLLINYFGEKRNNGTGLTENSTNSLIIGAGLSSSADQLRWRTQSYAQIQQFESFFSSQSEDRSLERPALDQYRVPSVALGISAAADTDLTQILNLSSELSFRWVWGETNERFRFIDGIANREREAGGQDLQVDVSGGAKIRVSDKTALSLLLHAKLWERLNGSRVERDVIAGEETANNNPDLSRLLVGPRIQLDLEQFNPLDLRAAVYHNFRTPTLNELYRPFRVRNDITEANSSLKPEKLFGADLGANWKKEKSQASLNLFWNSIEDSVLNVSIAEGPGSIQPCGFVPEGGICRQRQNIGKLRSRGLEADILFTLFDTFDWGVSYQYLDSRISSAPNATQLEGKHTPQVPQHRASLRVTYETSTAGTLALVSRYEDSRFEDDLNIRKLEQYITLDAFYSLGLTKKMDLILQLENIANSKIVTGETANGLQTLGAPFFAFIGLKVKL